MKPKLAVIVSGLFILLLAGCSGLFQTTITITSVVDAAMKDWASLSVAGKTSPAIDAKVKSVHDQYRTQCAVVQSALLAYKANGDTAPYIQALSAARVIAANLIDLVVPLVSQTEGVTLKSNLGKATKI